MSHIKLILNDKKEITKVELKSAEVNSQELFDIATTFLGVTCKTILNNRAQNADYTEDISKADRSAMYDSLVLYLSVLANTIYPENEELKGSPEDFMAELDRKIALLQDLEAKHGKD